jgi:hypothetical protein
MKGPHYYEWKETLANINRYFTASSFNNTTICRVSDSLMASRPTG